MSHECGTSNHCQSAQTAISERAHNIYSYEYIYIYIVTKNAIIYIVTKNAIVPGALHYNQLSYGGRLASSDRYYGVCSSSIVLHNVGNERDT